MTDECFDSPDLSQDGGRRGTGRGATGDGSGFDRRPPPPLVLDHRPVIPASVFFCSLSNYSELENPLQITEDVLRINRHL